jgi:hypothetical protein
MVRLNTVCTQWLTGCKCLEANCVRKKVVGMLNKRIRRS